MPSEVFDGTIDLNQSCFDCSKPIGRGPGILGCQRADRNADKRRQLSAFQ